MAHAWGPRLRPERLIGAARVVLALFSLFAVWLDPTEPAKYASLAYGLLGAYVAYAMGVAAFVWRREGVPARWPLVTHALDLLFFSLFIFFTAGPGSPFNVYYVFALMCAALRWQLKGTVWTAVASLTVFAGFGVYFAFIDDDPGFDLRAFVIRGDYLVVLTVLLAYVGAHEQRLLRDMWLLASWPQATDARIESMVRPLLAHAGVLLDAPSLGLVWRGPGEGYSHVTVLAGSEWHQGREPELIPPVTPELGDRSFLWPDTAAALVLVQDGPDPRRLSKVRSAPLNARWVQRLSARSVLSVTINGDMTTGRLFVLNKPQMSADDMLVAGIVSTVIGARLDGFYVERQVQAAAATEERVRLARDLHDGILQSLTGIGLRLAVIRGRIAASEGGPLQDVDELQQIITHEQKEIRFLIDESRPSPADTRSDLPHRLRDLVTRFEREWDLDVRLELDAMPALSPRLAQDVYHLVRESLSNAARHGLATSVDVQVKNGDNTVTITVRDDGKGFPFEGSYSGAELVTMGVGPRSLRERVQAVNGSLTVNSNPQGAALHIVLPTAE